MWAARRIRQGWTVGPKRDHSKQCHPHLVPWDALPITYRQERTRATRCLFKVSPATLARLPYPYPVC